MGLEEQLLGKGDKAVGAPAEQPRPLRPCAAHATHASARAAHQRSLPGESDPCSPAAHATLAAPTSSAAGLADAFNDLQMMQLQRVGCSRVLFAGRSLFLLSRRGAAGGRMGEGRQVTIRRHRRIASRRLIAAESIDSAGWPKAVERSFRHRQGVQGDSPGQHGAPAGAHGDPAAGSQPV